MANQAGANWKEPAASAPPATAASAAPIATAAAATPAAGAAAAAAKPDGKTVFEQTCTVCHGQGIAGAPKFGDKALWAPRIAQGTNVLYEHALKGFQGKGGLMPPHGGNTALSDADVKAAVDYMVAAVK
jgi:cytochrome c5